MTDIQKIIQTLHPLERKVVPFLNKVKTLSELVSVSKLQEVEAMRALQWLENKGVLKINSENIDVVELGTNGKNYVSKGLPEKRMLLEVKNKPQQVKELINKLGNEEFTIAIGVLKQKAAINILEGNISITDQGKKLLEKESLEDQLIKKLSKGAIEINKLEAEEKFALNNLIKRKQILEKNTIRNKIIILTDIGKSISKEKIDDSIYEEKLTSEMLKTGKWKGKKFRAYDVSINVPEISGGKRHFMKQAIEYIKQIWLEMGFEEMTGPHVETSYWDLDALFVPQDHPARTMQDTFYVADETGKKILKGNLPKDYKKVKEVHENGSDTGSKGWQITWNEELSKEVILRTHCTVLSAKTISKLKEKDLPKKYFAVSRVFRNETMDWKHLFEFEQVEGIVVDKNVTFRHLLGYLKQFFSKMGFEKIRIRPSHFPYTEPSVEIDVYNQIKKEWVELGGAGIFRPEVTKTLIGIEVPVLAWGIGLGRIVKEYWNIQDIRETYNNDIGYLKNMNEWMK